MNAKIFKKLCISFLGALSLLSAAPSWASGLGIDCVYPDTYYVYLPPMTINVGRDAPVGEPIGPWTTASALPTWTCYRTSTSYGVILLGVAAYGPYTKYGNITVDGQNFGIYNSTVKTGLGYIVRWRTTYNGQTSPWQALSANGGVTVAPETLFGPVEYDAQTRFPLNVEVQVQFVKTSTGLTAGNVAAFDPLYIQPYRSLNGGSQIDQGPYRIVDYKAGDLKIATGGTCTTPNVNVPFPTVPISAFTGIGSTAGVTSFNLSFNNCPAGFNSIGYTFSPTTSIADAGQGVVTLSTTSTAKGVGIQITTNDNTPIQYGSVYNLENYDPFNTKSYTVPFKAALYQYESQASAGSIKGAVTFTMTYK